MIRLATLCFAVLLLSSCAPAPHVSTAARAELAPTGRLRVGINVQNFLLVNKERSGGQYSGIAVDLGRELGKRLGVPVELVPFDTAGKLADAVKSGAWDVAFLGNEPARANEIAFSAAYLEIEAGYLVPAGSPIRTIEDVDREGVRVAVNAKSAYDLYLTLNLQRAKLFRAPTVAASYELFVVDKLAPVATGDDRKVDHSGHRSSQNSSVAPEPRQSFRHRVAMPRGADGEVPSCAGSDRFEKYEQPATANAIRMTLARPMSPFSPPEIFPLA